MREEEDDVQKKKALKLYISSLLTNLLWKFLYY
jgi:hypothetical protein